MNIIGIAGKKGVGKDTAGKVIKNILVTGYGKKVVITHFAQPIKAIGRIFGYSDYQINFDKDDINTLWNLSWRHFAQQIGTDLFRSSWHSQTWLILMGNQIKHFEDEGYEYVIIPDVRFANELDFIKERLGTVINIERVTGFNDPHPSELGVTGADFTIPNHRDIDLYYERIAELTHSLLKGHCNAE